MKVSSFWRLNTERPFQQPASRDARASAFCLTQSANPLTSPAKSHRPLCFLSSRLFSPVLFLSRHLVQFLFTSLFLSARLAPIVLWAAHILLVLNGLWPGHSWVPVFLYFSVLFLFHHLSNKCTSRTNLGTAGTWETLWSYLTPKGRVHMRLHPACFVWDAGGCCHKCNLRCHSDATMKSWKQWVASGRWGE